MLIIPVLLLGACILVGLARVENGVLFFILSTFAFISGQEEGLQIQEMAYGLLYLGFLASWYFSRFFYYKDRILDSGVDKAMMAFLVIIHLSIPISLLFGGSMKSLISDWLAISMLAFYFPIKETVKRKPESIKIFGLIFLWLAVFVFFRNAMEFRQTVTQAAAAYEIVSGRANTNEIVLMAGSVGAIVYFLYSSSLVRKGLSIGFFLVFFAGLILTQSRGYWLAFIFGMGVLFLFASMRKRGELILLATSGLAGVVAIGFLVAPEVMELFVVGIVERITSVGSAGSSDISMLNRFNEFAAVWEGIKSNPILGYGLGHEFVYHNIIYESHIRQAFMHNVYLAIWYKFGIVGLGLALYVWIGSAWKGLTFARANKVSGHAALIVLSASLLLFCEMVVGNTSNPLVIEDGALMFAFSAALISGSVNIKQNERS